ncbi:aminotransferase class I/II-fold pyridoxal phosphate-dependent enzyme [Amphibacillus jilinensis]|uniref:aminotransferase class I/II-fold pyridoxal phosphate-dependent enzyme n=1 Tax=Amphibacillus jilinensis TaxID=1216008 RepID=UPI0003125CB4|nr:aminotransferase class I/II-fold pyridoxal phosphate-dependent enzyme [Amphibacillus jilinensis]
MQEHEKTPLFSGLLQHINQQPLAFHIPGHKSGRGIDPSFKNFMGDNALSIDLINISPLDDLHHPQGIIKEAEQLAAQAFGADFTFFSVQGTSTPIMAMVLSVCQPGDKIIVPRNIHKSVTSAIIFSGAIPIFVHPELDTSLGIAHGITPRSVEHALDAHPDAKAVFVINPTYFGIAADLRKIVEIAHKKAIPVLVDEAHGVHIHFHEDLPLSAMEAGADLAATSVHKLGGSLTQSSVLNGREGLIVKERVQNVLSMLTTTSTSYLLLASLDVARKQLALHGHRLLTETITRAQDLRKQINDLNYLYCPGKEILGTDATFNYDPTKILISVKQLGVTGYDVESWLREHYQIEVELSDMYNILCIITPGDHNQHISTLLTALKDLVYAFKHHAVERQVQVSISEIPALSMSPRDAFYADTETIKLSEAVGRISAESIMIYPPGIPIFIPGEIITEENLDYIKKNIEVGLPVQGLEDVTLETIHVIKEMKPFT